jgi:hypothetical protein
LIGREEMCIEILIAQPVQYVESNIEMVPDLFSEHPASV